MVQSFPAHVQIVWKNTSQTFHAQVQSKDFSELVQKYLFSQDVTLDAHTRMFDKTSEMPLAQSSERHLSLANYIWFKFSKVAYKIVLRTPAEQNLLKIGGRVTFRDFS